MVKKFYILGVIMMTSIVTMANDVIVAVNQLPEQAQVFMKTYFAQDNIAYATADKTVGFITEYNVRLADGTEIEFSRDGSLKKVDCKMRPIPTGVVPQKIVAYIQTAFPNTMIKEYKIEFFGQKVELTNELELVFDKDGNPTGIDD